MTCIPFLIETIFNTINSDTSISETRVFLSIFLSISEIYIQFETFSKKMSLITDVFGKLRTSEKVVRKMSKKSSYR